MALITLRLRNRSTRRLLSGNWHSQRRWNAALEKTFTRRGQKGSLAISRKQAVVAKLGPSRIHHPGVTRSLDYLSRHWRESVGVMDLVRVAQMSRRGFLKAFSKHTGDTPGRKLRAIRLENARELLLESNYKLAVVARSCGFQSVNSFIVAFKRRVGVAPIQYRAQAIRWALAVKSESKSTHNSQSTLHKL